jgi:E3 ubiquitin-protein ligase ZNF598
VRLRALTQHPTNAVAGTKLALRDYAASQSGARDLISTLWNILNCDLDATASIVNLIVDFLEEEEKKTDLLGAWNGFKIERRRELPDFMPTSIGTDYAGIADGRTLNAATARRAAPGQAQRAVWDRVAQAAERGASFPPLRTPPQQPQQLQSQTTAQPRLPQPPSTGPTPNFRKNSGRNTAWSASAAGVSANGGGGGSADGSSNSNVSTSQSLRPPAPSPPAPALTNAAFPTLPGSAAPRARPVVSARTSQLHHVMGSAPPATSAWAPGRAAQDDAGGSREAEEGAAPAEVAAGGKKKGKAKQKKQTLFVLSYPGPSTARQG